ncbi:hypothetical protein DL96DRAFT_1631375 [Flagelloscypha sp. PMI_526]|nr:hypothetical protein DL96DRAFT_1631375 [Flagelloscypha sp. PMI_526]
MNLDPDPNMVTFNSQVGHLVSFIPRVPPSPRLSSVSNAARNTLPFSSHGQDIRVTYNLAKSQEQQLRAQQKCVEGLLTRISRALDKHMLFIKKHKPLLSSYQRLPPEIWTMIFEEASLSDATTDAGINVLSAHKTIAPFSLSHVCSEWRRLSLRTPSLWTTLRLRVEDEISESATKLLNAFLARGRNEPLVISMEFQENAETRTSVDAFGLYSIQPLFDQQMRWRSVDFSIPVSALCSRLFPVKDVPLLKTFRLRILPFEIREGQNPPWMPTAVIQNSPVLSHLTLQNFFGIFAPSPDLPSLFDWRTITSFGLCDPNDLPLCMESIEADIEEGMELTESLLSLASSLRSWTWVMSGVVPTISGANSNPRLSHPHLQSVQLLLNDTDALRSFEFPALKSISLTFERFVASSSDLIRSFLQRSPNLEKVEFQGYYSGLLNTLNGIGLGLKQITFRCLASYHYPSFRSAISVLTRDNIPSLEKVTLLLWPDPEMELPISVSMVETGRQLALHEESRGHPTIISLIVYPDELEEEVNEALHNLEELALANLEILRV